HIGRGEDPALVNPVIVPSGLVLLFARSGRAMASWAASEVRGRVFSSCSRISRRHRIRHNNPSYKVATSASDNSLVVGGRAYFLTGLRPLAYYRDPHSSCQILPRHILSI